MIAHLGLAQGGFQRTRLHIGTEQNGVILPRNAFGHPMKLNLVHNRGGLFLFIGERLQSH